MPGVALPIPFDGVSEMFQRAIIAALVLGDAAIAGMDIAERDRIVGFSHDAFGLLQEPGGPWEFPLLKAQPTLQDLHHRSRAAISELQRKFAPLDSVRDSALVLAQFPLAATLPEVCQGQQLL